MHFAIYSQPMVLNMFIGGRSQFLVFQENEK